MNYRSILLPAEDTKGKRDFYTFNQINVEQYSD